MSDAATETLHGDALFLARMTISAILRNSDDTGDSVGRVLERDGERVIATVLQPMIEHRETLSANFDLAVKLIVPLLTCIDAFKREDGHQNTIDECILNDMPLLKATPIRPEEKARVYHLLGINPIS